MPKPKKAEKIAASILGTPVSMIEVNGKNSKKRRENTLHMFTTKK